MSDTNTSEFNRKSTAGLLKELAEIENTQGDHPILFIIGSFKNVLAVDETVVSRLGTIDGYPLYKLVPRSYRFTDDGHLVILDDHSDWLNAGNPEEVSIPPEAIELCLIATPATDSLQLPEMAPDVFVRSLHSQEAAAKIDLPPGVHSQSHPHSQSDSILTVAAEKRTQTFDVLERLREFFDQGEAPKSQKRCNEAHALVQEFTKPPADSPSDSTSSAQRTAAPVALDECNTEAEVQALASRLRFDADRLDSAAAHENNRIVDDETRLTQKDLADLYRSLADQLESSSEE